MLAIVISNLPCVAIAKSTTPLITSIEEESPGKGVVFPPCLLMSSQVLLQALSSIEFKMTLAPANDNCRAIS